MLAALAGDEASVGLACTSVGLCPAASPCMSTLSPALKMKNSAAPAKMMKATKIFHMIISLWLRRGFALRMNVYWR